MGAAAPTAPPLESATETKYVHKDRFYNVRNDKVTAWAPVVVS